MTDQRVVPLTPVTGANLPPQDLDAEATVITTLIPRSEADRDQAGEAFDRVQELLRPEHFYADQNRRIYEAIVALHIAGKQVDITSVLGELRAQGRLPQVGGSSYLASLVDYQPATAYVEQHARTVIDKWRLREVIASGRTMMAAAIQPVGDVQQLIEQYESALGDLAHSYRQTTLALASTHASNALNKLTAARDRGDETAGIQTGLADFDRKTGGLYEGDLFIVAGRPGMGKTAAALSFVLGVTDPGYDPLMPPAELPTAPDGALFWSGEMPAEQVALRLVCALEGLDFQRIRVSPAKDDWKKLINGITRLSHYPIWIDDQSGRTVQELRGMAKKLQRLIVAGRSGVRCRKLRLVAVDYIQLVKGRGREHSREQEVSGISQDLKGLAKEVSVPVLALSQLNREVERRNKQDKRPALSDLRESGAIEQDADTVMFIYRASYYDQSQKDGETEFIIAKQRNGATGTVLTYFDAARMRFRNLSHDDWLGEFDP